MVRGKLGPIAQPVRNIYKATFLLSITVINERASKKKSIWPSAEEVRSTSQYWSYYDAHYSSVHWSIQLCLRRLLEERWRIHLSH